MYLRFGSTIFYAIGKEEIDVTQFNLVNPLGMSTTASWADHTA